MLGSVHAHLKLIKSHLNTIIGQKIREQQSERLMSQAECAYKLGISVPSLESMENGFSSGLKTLIRIKRWEK